MNLKFLVCVIVLVRCAHFSAQALGDVISVPGNIGDYCIYRPRGSQTLYAKGGDAGHRVGFEYYPGTTTNDVNVIHVFPLPALTGKHLVAADYSFKYLQNDNYSRENVDVWGIGFQVGTSPIVEFYDGDGPTTDGFSGNVKLQDNILVQSTSVGTIHTNASGDSNLLDYLNSFYEVNQNYVGGSYVLLRLNNDAPGSYNGDGYQVAMQEYSGAGPVLTLETGPVPEPSTIFLAALVLAPIVLRRSAFDRRTPR